MEEIQEYLDKDKKSTTQVSFKVSKTLDKILDVITEYRVSKGLSTNKSDVLRIMVIVAINSGNPEKIIPHFLMPDLDDIISKLEDKNSNQGFLGLL